MTDQPDLVLGFDGTDDLSVVVMARSDDGAWRVESEHGPDAGQFAAELIAALPTPPPPPQTIGELVHTWLENFAADRPTFELTPWQRQVITKQYVDAIRAGRLAHPAVTLKRHR